MRTCPTCGAPVIGLADHPLDAQPHQLGIWHPSGRKLTVDELRAAIRAGDVIGHHPHICRPAPPPAPDPTLF